MFPTEDSNTSLSHLLKIAICFSACLLKIRITNWLLNIYYVVKIAFNLKMFPTEDSNTSYLLNLESLKNTISDVPDDFNHIHLEGR